MIKTASTFSTVEGRGETFNSSRASSLKETTACLPPRYQESRFLFACLYLSGFPIIQAQAGLRLAMNGG